MLGPLLFLLYVNDIYNSSGKLSFYLFADDINVLYVDENLRSLKIMAMAAGNFYLKHSRTEHMKNSFSRIGAKIWNSIPDSDGALPKYKFKDTLQSRLLDILIEEDNYIGVRT